MRKTLRHGVFGLAAMAAAVLATVTTALGFIVLTPTAAQALPGYCVGVNEHVGSGSICTP